MRLSIQFPTFKNINGQKTLSAQGLLMDDSEYLTAPEVIESGTGAAIQVNSVADGYAKSVKLNIAPIKIQSYVGIPIKLLDLTSSDKSHDENWKNLQRKIGARKWAYMSSQNIFSSEELDELNMNSMAFFAINLLSPLMEAALLVMDCGLNLGRVSYSLPSSLRYLNQSIEKLIVHRYEYISPGGKVPTVVQRPFVISQSGYSEDDIEKDPNYFDKLSIGPWYKWWSKKQLTNILIRYDRQEGCFICQSKFHLDKFAFSQGDTRKLRVFNIFDTSHRVELLIASRTETFPVYFCDGLYLPDPY